MALFEELLLGVYIGVLTGVFAALLVFTLAFSFQYIAGVNFPAMYGMIIGLGAAGLQGGIRAFIRNPELLRSSTAVVALLIVMGVALYAHKMGQKLGKELPSKQVVLGGLRRRALSPELVKGMGRFGQVTVRQVGEVGDMEGYLPLPADIRTAIRGGEWTFPADLPLRELERRLADKLKNEHDLEDATVRIDEKGRARIAAAPPESGLSRRVPGDREAVTIDAVVPAGLAEGDEVRIEAGGETVEGRVLGVATDGDEPEADAESGDTDSEDADGEVPVKRATAGGTGRVALAVDPGDVERVVGEAVTRLVVRSRGQNREYELVSLLRREGNGFRKLPLTGDGEFVGRTLGDVQFRERHGVAVFAIKRADEWLFAPDGTTTLQAEDELFVTGPREGLAALGEAVA
ncbi:MAG: potassium channel family protein [Halobacteriaceae archaeon]